MAVSTVLSPLSPPTAAAPYKQQAQPQTQPQVRDTGNAELLPILNVSRLLARLEQNLLSPVADLKSLRRSEYQRMRVGGNIAYARANLQSLEKSLPSIKDSARRHDIQVDLARKKQVVKALEGILEDVSAGSLNEDGESKGEDDDDDDNDNTEGELLVLEDGDMVQEPSRGEHNPDPTSTTSATSTPTPTPAFTPAPASAPAYTNTSTTATSTATEAPTPTLRNRHNNPQPTTTPKHTSQNQDIDQAHATEQAISTDRLEQESLTDSLLSLATQLKTSSTAFHASLENEKSVLDRAVNGLDVTTASMNAAEKRMGMLRKMTEGKGWWGRMMLNLWIVALWVVAILIVFVGPKIRF